MTREYPGPEVRSDISAMKVWLIFLVAPVLGYIHPPLNLSEWESLTDYRQSRNITFHYQPRHIPAEECRYLTEEECQDQDEEAKQRRLQFVAEQPRTGSIRALVLLVLFPGHENRNLPSREYFQQLCDGTGSTATNSAPTMAAYFSEQSYGKYNITCDVTDWILTNQTEEQAAQGVSGRLGNNGAQVFFHAALEKYADKQELDGGFDWSEKYDTVRNIAGGQFTDGNFDALLVIHSGVGAETGARDCEGQTRENRIWAQGYANSNGWKNPFGRIIAVGGYGIASAFRQVGIFGNANCRYEPASMGIVVHEWFHTFDMPDLYDLSATNTFGGIGSFGLMASPRGFSDESRPGSLSPWVKNQLGWIEEFKEIKTDGSYTITPSQDSPDVYAIYDKFGTGPSGANQREYLVIENRQKKSFDSGIFGNGGIIIWHVDDFVGTFNNEGSFPGQSEWPARHYRVAVVQADGNFEIERGINDGEVNDLWTGGMSLRPGIGGRQPNTDSYQGGVIAQTGITIAITSPSQNAMSFTVTGLAQATESTPAPTPSATSNNGTPSPCPVLGCGGFQGITNPPTRAPSSDPASSTGEPSPTPAPTPSGGSGRHFQNALYRLVATASFIYLIL